MTVEQKADKYREELKSNFFLSEPQLDCACQGFKDGYHVCEKELKAQIEKMKNCWNCKHDCKLLIARFGGCDFSGKKEKWYKTVEEKGLGWIEGLTFMVMEEAKEQLRK